MKLSRSIIVVDGLRGIVGLAHDDDFLIYRFGPRYDRAFHVVR